jgi:large subunit ribosomal protein L35
MPKLKTKKGAQKRFKITGTGKIRAPRAGKSHLQTGKTRKRKRSLRGTHILTGGTERAARRLLPYG